MARNMTDNVVPSLLDVQIGNCLLYQLYKEIKYQFSVVSFVPLHPSGQKTIHNKLQQVCVVLQEKLIIVVMLITAKQLFYLICLPQLSVNLKIQ